jgi:endonuclease/exonuclease/phosphatase family metal-dependent hydrolase
MRVMTFNLRFENDQDGPNNWIHRRDLVVEIISKYKPAILGTQEGKWSQLSYLCENLPDYEPVMPGRAPDKKIQCPTLFFRKKDISIEAGRDFWLSKTPEVHLSKDWDSAFPRMISFANIRVDSSDRKLVAAVTHLDHIGKEARYQQAKIISEWAGQQEVPIILAGDFNVAPQSRVHKMLTAPRTRLGDTWEMVGNKNDEASFTHHGFTGIPQIARIDWILVDSIFKVKSVKIIKDSYNGQYPSDHFPYMADLYI